PAVLNSDNDKLPDVFWRWLHKLRDRLPPEERKRRFAAQSRYPAEITEITEEEWQRWHRVQVAIQIRYGRPEVRSGRTKFSTKDIMQMCSKEEDSAILQTALPKGHTLNSVGIGRWLRNQLADAPIDGLYQAAE